MLILTQTEKDKTRFEKLNAKKVHHVGNIKHCALPLPFDNKDLDKLKQAIQGRPFWVYASTHEGEEILAARIHEKLKGEFPNILTIIIPRHPERREEISKSLSKYNLCLRGEIKKLPQQNDDLYIADTLGELGLFYKAAPIAMIGRSFSDDGGGGHNPLEAAQLHCAVLTGPNVQYQQEIFDDMIEVEAAKRVINDTALFQELQMLFSDKDVLTTAQQNALKYTQTHLTMIDGVIDHIKPILNKAMKK